MIPAICLYTFYIGARDTVVTLILMTDDTCPISSDMYIHTNIHAHTCYTQSAYSKTYTDRYYAYTRHSHVQVE